MDSERLAQEDELLRQIRLAISSLGSIRTTGTRRKGAMYASTPITSGRRLYEAMVELGFRSAEEFKRTTPERFKQLVMDPNIHDGDAFGEILRSRGWSITIVPGQFWAPDWKQTHYMAFWRTVIMLFTRSTCQNIGWAYSTGSVEEFLIALRCNVDGKQRKRMFVRTQGGQIVPADNRKCADEIRRAMDQIDMWNFDVSPLYDLWREISLTIDATLELARVSVAISQS